jgi:hypothetical protein
MTTETAGSPARLITGRLYDGGRAGELIFREFPGRM